MMQPLPSLLVVILLALVHLFAWRLDFLRGARRSRWLSLAGGVGVGYVFAHILPELAEIQRRIHETHAHPGPFWRRFLYLVALAGLAIFYGIERSAKRTRRENGEQTGRQVASRWVFVLHTAVMACYAAFIGYLVIREESRSLMALGILFVVLAVHLASNDRALEHDYQEMYLRVGRWVIAAAIVIGWIVGYATAVHPLAFAVCLAVIAGGIIFTAIKEELPPERDSRVMPFLAGMAVTAGTLVLASSLGE